jgi:hypothetical protein
MKITYLLRFFIYIFAVVIVGPGCATLESRLPVYDQSLTTAPLPEGSARVCLARRFDMFHVTGQHVLDSGSGISYNAKLIRRKDISFQQNDNSWVVQIDSKYPMPSNQYESYITINPIYIVLPEPMVEQKSSVVYSINDNFNYIFAIKDIGFSKYKLKYLDITSSVRAFPYNARYQGKVGNDDYVIFDRQPGNMKLRLVPQRGFELECFSPEFKIEAGKRYLVDYQFGLSKCSFSIQERP